MRTKIKTAATIAVIATKGGVGKTTLAANLGGIIADDGSRVLLVDADPQPSLSSYYPVSTVTPRSGITHLLTSGDQPEPASTSIDNLDIIVSDDPNADLENRLLHDPAGRMKMLNALDTTAGYDFIIVDTRGASGVLAENAALAADLCISPLLPEALAAQEFVRGTVQLIRNLEPLRQFGFAPGELHALFCRCDRTNDSQTVMQTLTETIESLDVGLLRTRIPNRVAYREAAALQIPVHAHEPRRRKGESARQSMDALRMEIMTNLTNNAAVQ